jgi:hypothetical protein
LVKSDTKSIYEILDRYSSLDHFSKLTFLLNHEIEASGTDKDILVKLVQKIAGFSEEYSKYFITAYYQSKVTFNRYYLSSHQPPANPKLGDIYLCTLDNTYYVWAGTNWATLVL